MSKLYTAGIILSTVMLISFSFNPPDGHTGAPGDQLCSNCHLQSNPQQNGFITLEGFPQSITPGDTYNLTLVSRDTSGLAERAGFQVTILTPNNTRAGDMSSPSNSSTTSIFNNRQYWDHNPAVLYPDSNVVRWSVMWTAPELKAGSTITWYAAGNIANGNNQETGDRIVTATGSGEVVLSSTEDFFKDEPALYPNPGSDELNILLPGNTAATGEITFYHLSGKRAGFSILEEGKVNTSLIVPGIYLLEVKTDTHRYLLRWSKF